MNLLLLRLLPVLAVWAYGGGDGTESQSPPHTDISGSWTYSATLSMDLGAHGTATCSMSGVQVSLSQSGSSVSGTAHGGKSVCDPPSLGLEPPPEENPTEILGTVDEDSVSFNAVSLNADGSVLLLSHEGTVSGDSMSGTLEGTLSGGVSVAGNWSASR